MFKKSTILITLVMPLVIVGCISQSNVNANTNVNIDKVLLTEEFDRNSGGIGDRDVDVFPIFTNEESKNVREVFESRNGVSPQEVMENIGIAVKNGTDVVVKLLTEMLPRYYVAPEINQVQGIQGYSNENGANLPPIDGIDRNEVKNYYKADLVPSFGTHTSSYGNPNYVAPEINEDQGYSNENGANLPPIDGIDRNELKNYYKADLVPSFGTHTSSYENPKSLKRVDHFSVNEPWYFPFDPRRTSRQPFRQYDINHRVISETIVNMMENTATVPYCNSNHLGGFQAIALPLRGLLGVTWYAVVMVPYNYDYFKKRITLDDYYRIVSQMSSGVQRVTYQIPKINTIVYFDSKRNNPVNDDSLNKLNNNDRSYAEVVADEYNFYVDAYQYSPRKQQPKVVNSHANGIMFQANSPFFIYMHNNVQRRLYLWVSIENPEK